MNGDKEVVLDINGKVTTTSAQGHTVADVLAEKHVDVKAEDLVVPGPDSVADDGETIVVRTSREVTVEFDGTAEKVETTAQTVGELLAELGPRIEGAQTPANRSEPLGRAPVQISTQKTVTVQVDGKNQPIRTSEATVRGVLAHAGIVLGESDKASVALDSPATDGMTVAVNRAATAADTAAEVLPFETQEQPDDTLLEGQRVVAQAGVVGEATTTYAVKMVGGVEESRTVVTRAVTREPVTEIVKVGTMKVSAEVTEESGSAGEPVVSGSPRAIGRALAAQRGWGGDQFACLDKLWTKESNWRVTADNPTSSAYGIPQSLPGSKMASAGSDWRTNPATQITWGLGYIAGRYGTPCSAWAHSRAHNWY